MRAKKIFCMFMVVFMCFSITACGSKSDDSKEKYKLDYESTEVQPMSEERASADVLKQTEYEWLEGATIFPDGSSYSDYTYEDFVKHIGVDASQYQYSSDFDGRMYIWIAKESDNKMFSILLKESGGVWNLDSAGCANI